MIKRKYSSNKVAIILLALLLAIFSIIPTPKTLAAESKTFTLGEELNSSIVEELNHVDFSKLNEAVSNLEEGSNIFSIENIKQKVYSILSGENAMSYSSFFSSIFSILIDMVLKYLPLLSLIVAIGVISNLLTGMKSKFNEKSTADLIHLVCFLAVVILIIGIVNNISVSAGKSISSMVGMMNAVFPVLLTLMVGIGAGASASVYQPIVAILSTYVADFFNYFIMPLFLFSFVFNIISHLSNNVKLDKFNSFISSLFKWSVGLIFTIFFATMTIQGISAGSFDSLSVRTTKYTIKSYVPIMGGYLSDGMDLILSSSILIKNSLGLVGIMVIAGLILSPLLEIAVLSLMLKLVSAILQPLSNNKTSNFLTGVSKSIVMLSTCILAVGFMYLISIGLIMTTSNVVI